MDISDAKKEENDLKFEFEILPDKMLITTRSLKSTY